MPLPPSAFRAAGAVSTPGTRFPTASRPPPPLRGAPPGPMSALLRPGRLRWGRWWSAAAACRAVTGPPAPSAGPRLQVWPTVRGPGAVSHSSVPRRGPGLPGRNPVMIHPAMGPARTGSPGAASRVGPERVPSGSWASRSSTRPTVGAGLTASGPVPSALPRCPSPGSSGRRAPSTGACRRVPGRRSRPPSRAPGTASTTPSSAGPPRCHAGPARGPFPLDPGPTTVPVRAQRAGGQGNVVSCHEHRAVQVRVWRVGSVAELPHRFDAHPPLGHGPSATRATDHGARSPGSASWNHRTPDRRGSARQNDVASYRRCTPDTTTGSTGCPRGADVAAGLSPGPSRS